MMKVSVLASGSKGNCTYIETEQSKVLVDIGTSCLYVERNLREIGINPNMIDGIVLTHTHIDHIQGLRVFLKKYHTKVYLSRIMYEELKKELYLENYEYIEDNFTINDLTIEVLKTSHDTEDSNGYIFTKGSSNLAYITDTGYIHKKYHEKLKNMNLYIMESNHDIEMLMNGKYPYHLKQRILGSRGHLSNEDASQYLTSFIGSKTKDIILIHLSEENNKETIALETLEHNLSNSDKEYSNINIIISKQTERTELIEV